MKYAVTYEETLARTIIVEADSYADAEDKMMDAVERGLVELTADDFIYDSGCISFIDRATDIDEEFYVNLDSFISRN